MIKFGSIAILGLVGTSAAFSRTSPKHKKSFVLSAATSTIGVSESLDLAPPAPAEAKRPPNDFGMMLYRPVDSYGRSGDRKMDSVDYPPGSMKAAVGSEVAEIITQQEEAGIHCHSSDASHSRHLNRPFRSFF